MTKALLFSAALIMALLSMELVWLGQVSGELHGDVMALLIERQDMDAELPPGVGTASKRFKFIQGISVLVLMLPVLWLAAVALWLFILGARKCMDPAASNKPVSSPHEATKNGGCP